MSLANCPQCGKLFNKALRDVCPDCVKKEEEQFFVVRDFLRKNRNAKPYEVSDSTEVPVQTIYKFVREGRLQARFYDGLHYECEKCGKAIVTGKYCKDCMDEMTRNVQQLKNAVESSKEKQVNIGYHHFKGEDRTK